MQKVKNKRELRKAKESFYDKAMKDPGLREFTKKLLHLPVDDPEYNKVLDEMFNYLDGKFQEEVGIKPATIN